MCSITTDLPNTSLPSPPAQTNWSCRQRARLSSSKPPPLPSHYDSSRFLEGGGFQQGNGHSFSFGGLKTPPTDDMSAACHQPPLGYDTHAFPQALPQTGHPRAPASESALPSQRYRAYNSQQHQPPQTTYRQPSRLPPLVQSETAGSQAQLPPASSNSAHQRSHTNAQHTLLSNAQQRPRSTTPRTDATIPQSRTKESKALSLTGQSNEIPDFISAQGGSLSDLVAQLTCFFWFEPIEVLTAAATFRTNKTPVRRPHPESIPDATFMKWVHTILNTTQVTRNVILLALLFIYRLKTSNPTVRGRSGSEYRLLTVALMLGNKFLDDNTYTNKTWADVSYLSVSDIHLMEVEFLSNMRYSLMTTADQWDEWLDKMGSFHDYFEAVLSLPTPSPLKLSIPSPTAPLYSSPLPSPTAYGNGMVPYSANAMPSASGHNWVPVSSPMGNRPNLKVTSARKRSIDKDLTEPPAKRISHGPYSMPSVPRAPVTAPVVNTAGDAARRPGQVPTLTINTQAMPTQVPLQYGQAMSTPTASQPSMSLPPLVPGVRAMATVYSQTPVTAPSLNPTAPTFAPQLPTPHPGMPNQTAFLASQQPAAQQSLQQMHQPQNQAHHAPTMTFTTPTKSQSHATHAGVYSSPLSEPYHSGSMAHTPGIHTPISHSPSVYLQQRPSPYKPVRHVNTLLYPPPSASLEEYHLAVPPHQIHYHPLGRRNDLRTGIVPDFMPYRGGYQSHTPGNEPRYP